MNDFITKAHALVGTGLPQTISRREAEVFAAKFDRDWLNPISMSKLQLAVKDRKDRVELNDILYDITYETKEYPVTGVHELVKLKRVDGEYAPFGWVNVQRIMEFKFEK